MYPHLFEPLQVRGMTIRNRVALPAMATRLTSEDGFVTDELIGYYQARAKGGCGLLIIEATSVHQPTAPRKFLRICGDEYIPGLKKLADAIHKEGGRCAVQLWQGGFAAFASDADCAAIVPDEMQYNGVKLPPASAELIQDCVKAFGKAAARAAQAGFDTVEFHCGHQYSPHHFLSGAFNHRTDEYGGSFENRMRYPLECILAIRKSVPKDFPVQMRIVAQDDMVDNGNTIEDTIAFVKRAKAAGVDMVNVSRGNKMGAAFKYEVPSLDIARGFNVDNAEKIREGADIKVIAVGRINDPDQAEEILSAGKADMIVMGRAQICDPEFCNKAKEGRPEDIVKCLGCNQGCLDRVQKGNEFAHVSCLRNPSVGEEIHFTLEQTNKPRRVLVIGGGMAGMEAAFTLKQRGHEPVLVEENDHLGGQFYLAGQAPRKQEMADAAISRSEQLARAGVEIRLNTKVDERLIDQIDPDAVIVATGASPICLPVPGIDNKNVYNTVQVLSGNTSFTGDTVVIGGGLVGIEVAEYLSARNCNVTVVEMLDRVARDVGGGRMIGVLEGIAKAGIKQVVNAKCVEILEDGVVVEVNGGRQKVPGANIVVAVGSRANDHAWIEMYCSENGIECSVVGDAVRARRAIDAIHEAVAAARAI